MKTPQTGTICDRIDLAKKDIDTAEIVSFDIFDTLVHRYVKEPVDVFEMASKHIKKKYKVIYLEHNNFLRNFKKIRVQAEADTRNEFYKKFKTFEITLDDIYERLYYQYDLNLEFLSFLKQAEITMELETIYPNQHVKELYNYAREKNKTIIATTDMYLPKAVIEKILLKCGYDGMSEIFCSGELKYSKHQGDIFPHICKKYKISAQELFHIGDNIESDYNIPVNHSCRAIHLDYKTEIHSSFSYFNEKPYLLTDSLISGVIQKIKLDADPIEPENQYFRIGYEVFGPVFTGYFLWIMNEIKKKPVDKILFFARDGFVLRNLYHKYRDMLGIDIPEEYVYISRVSSLLASFTDFTIDRLWFLFAGRNQKTVAKGLSNLNIDYRDIEEEIERIGFKNASDQIDFSTEKFMSLLIRLPDKIQQSAAAKRASLFNYINKVIGNHNKIAIVDIGWTGNMQGGFGRIAKLINPSIGIDGYYLGTSNGLKRSNLLTNNEYHGYLLNHGSPEDIYSNVLSPGGIELLELAFVAPHGTTLGYGKGEDATPILESDHRDIEYRSMAKQIQEGAYRFIDEIMPIITSLGVENFINTHWTIPFISLVTNPTENDALLLGAITHTDSSVTTSGRLPLAPQLARRLPEGDPAYISGLHRAIWKRGFEKLNKL